MKILITGGAGFIGSHLTENLLNEGHQVTVVDSLVTGDKANIEKFLDRDDFKFYNFATESPDFISAFISNQQKFDQVYNLACPTGVPNIEKLGDEMLQACSAGILNVLNLAIQANAQFLFTSSSEVYGDPQVFPQAEIYTGNVDPLGWRANYEEGKRFAETLVKRHVTAHSLNGKIVRLFNVYGPNMSTADYRVIPRFATQALSGEDLTVQGDGSQKRTMCYIDDLVAGLKIVMAKGEIGAVYNLGSDQEISMLELAKFIIKLTGSTSEIKFTERPSHDHNRRLPVLTAVHALGWEAKVSLKNGLIKTLTKFKDKLATEPSPTVSGVAPALVDGGLLSEITNRPNLNL